MRRLLPLGITLVAVLGADQLTKHWVASHLGQACHRVGASAGPAPRIASCGAGELKIELGAPATAVRIRNRRHGVDWSLDCTAPRPCLTGTLTVGRPVAGARARGTAPVLRPGGIYTVEAASSPPARLTFAFERPAPARVVIDGFFALEYAENPGAAFSFLARQPEVRRPLLIGIAVLALLFLGWMAWRLRPGQRLLAIALGLVMAGALGNLIDRIRLGYVIDFLLVHVRDSFRWPHFNVADAAIVVGLFLLLVDAWRGWRRQRRERRESAEASR